MSRKKRVVETPVIVERSYTVFDQRPPIRKEQGGYEANLVRMGEVKAKSSSEALELAKKRGLADKPVIWGEELERMRDIYQQRRPRYNQDED